MNSTVLIMTGSTGQRFWPLSTQERPKQLLNLFSDRTMLRETVDSVLPLVEPERIFITTNIMQSDAIMAELPFIPKKNIIIEPSSKDTAAAIGYGSLYINYFYPNSEIIVLAADHIILDKDRFRSTLVIALHEVRNNNTVVTLGIQPDRPETIYDYIEVEPSLNCGEVLISKQLFSKPSQVRAQEFYEKGNYLWNSGIFIFNFCTLLDEFVEYLPNHFQILMEILPYIEAGLEGELLADEIALYFDALEQVPFEYGIIEHSNIVKVIPVRFGWHDIDNIMNPEDKFSTNEIKMCRMASVDDAFFVANKDQVQDSMYLKKVHKD